MGAQRKDERGLKRERERGKDKWKEEERESVRPHGTNYQYLKIYDYSTDQDTSISSTS